MPTVHLSERSLIEIAGEEATDFLERLVTADVEGLAEDKAVASALLTPQGKILFDFVISRTTDGFRADIRSDQVNDFIRRLTLYRLRAKVTFEEKSDCCVYAIWDEQATDGAIPDTRFPAEANVFRAYGDLSSDATVSDWNELRIAHRPPPGGDNRCQSRPARRRNADRSGRQNRRHARHGGSGQGAGHRPDRSGRRCARQ